MRFLVADDAGFDLDFGCQFLDLIHFAGNQMRDLFFGIENDFLSYDLGDTEIRIPVGYHVFREILYAVFEIRLADSQQFIKILLIQGTDRNIFRKRVILLSIIQAFDQKIRRDLVDLVDEQEYRYFIGKDFLKDLLIFFLQAFVSIDDVIDDIHPCRLSKRFLVHIGA